VNAEEHQHEAEKLLACGEQILFGPLSTDSQILIASATLTAASVHATLALNGDGHEQY
jgi:hypothetical protein